ncbi:MAG: DPP IV N-terminal domain-containing protein, partial [Longimicrobiales bacterium]|nr:DPP IV N-terminal domain-containing protein [Longimicrobiales bacterium]
TTGLYINAIDNGGADVLGIDFTNSVPGDGSGATATSGGALVRWLDVVTAGFTVTESGGTTLVAENGTQDDFSVVLDAQPFSDVVLTVTSSDPGEATVSPSTMTFTNANWDSPQTVIVTGVDDVLVDGTQATTVTVSVDDALSDDDFDPLPDQTVTVSTADDDVAGFTIVESGGSTVVDETGTTDAFTVALDAQPLTDVVLLINSTDAGEATAIPSSLTFTNANWNVAQQVTVTGVSDSPLVDGDQITAVTVSVDDAASDDAFDPLADQSVNVTTIDVDPLIAFTSASAGNNDIWTRTTGGQLTQLTTPLETDWDPEWSPDGTQILFSSFRNGVNDHVWVMNADGTGQQALTSTAEQNVYASWSPDGSQIVFSAGSGASRNVWTMNADGTNRTQLTNSGSEDSQANWSPDGTQIVFFSARDNGVTWQLYTMNSDGTNESRLTTTIGNDYFPQYSPDGTQIVFVSDRDGNAEIYVMNADGTGQTRLTNNLATDIQPAWTPDGTQIVFSTDRDGDQELYIMNADGSNQTRLTNISGPDQFPSVKPNG